MSTPTGDAPDTMECRVCQTDVPAGEFCGLCGDFLKEKPGNGPSWLRLRAYGADPGEHLLRPSLASSIFPAAAAPVPTTVPAGACRRVARTRHVRDPADARGVDLGGVARPPTVVPAVHARDQCLPRCAKAHTASHHDVGYRARHRLGTSDRCDRRALVRRPAGRRDRGGPDSARGTRHPGRQHAPDVGARGGRAPAAAADARVHGRLHDRGARRACLHRGGDPDPAGPAVRHRDGRPRPSGQLAHRRGRHSWDRGPVDGRMRWRAHRRRAVVHPPAQQGPPARELCPLRACGLRRGGPCRLRRTGTRRRRPHSADTAAGHPSDCRRGGASSAATRPAPRAAA